MTQIQSTKTIRPMIVTRTTINRIKFRFVIAAFTSKLCQRTRSRTLLNKNSRKKQRRRLTTSPRVLTCIIYANLPMS